MIWRSFPFVSIIERRFGEAISFARVCTVPLVVQPAAHERHRSEAAATVHRIHSSSQL